MELPNDVWFHHILPHIHAKYFIGVCKSWHDKYINHIFDDAVIDHKFIDKVMPYEQSTLLLLQTREMKWYLYDYLFDNNKYNSVAQYLLYNNMVSVKSSYRAIVYALAGYFPLSYIMEHKVLSVNNIDVLRCAMYNEHVDMIEVINYLRVNGNDINNLGSYIYNFSINEKDIYMNFISALIRHPSIDITSHDNVLLVSCLKTYPELVPTLLEQDRVNNIHNITKTILQNYPHCNSLMQLTNTSPLKILSYILNTYITVLNNK